MIVIVYAVFLIVYVCMPIPLQIVAFFINTYVPDPIPVVDELLMVYSTLNKVKSVYNAVSYIEAHQ